MTDTNRQRCPVCNTELPSNDFNVCLTCSNALRRGETVKAERVYCMPNCVHTYVLAKLVKGELHMQFTDEPGRWHGWYTALTPREGMTTAA